MCDSDFAAKCESLMVKLGLAGEVLEGVEQTREDLPYHLAHGCAIIVAEVRDALERLWSQASA